MCAKINTEKDDENFLVSSFFFFFFFLFLVLFSQWHTYETYIRV